MKLKINICLDSGISAVITFLLTESGSVDVYNLFTIITLICLKSSINWFLYTFIVNVSHMKISNG